SLLRLVARTLSGWFCFLFHVMVLSSARSSFGVVWTLIGGLPHRLLVWLVVPCFSSEAAAVLCCGGTDVAWICSFYQCRWFLLAFPAKLRWFSVVAGLMWLGVVVHLVAKGRVFHQFW
ncbi:unnamed protein product, partial [Arabidopsis halleri]